MVQTRGQEHHDEDTKRKSDELSRKPEPNGHDAKRVHRPDGKPPAKEEQGFNSTLDRLLKEYGEPPLKELDAENLPASDVVMAHILHALLSSTRISHELSRSALRTVLDSQYHDLKVLHETSWYERTEVLTKGGYARYRERTASFLGDLLKLMEQKYGRFRVLLSHITRRTRLFVNSDNDAAKILPGDKEGAEARDELADRLREIKGLGPLGVDIAMGGLQSYFPNICPFLDTRSMKMAGRIGLGDDVDRLYEAVGEDSDKMARLEVALTEARLEKKEGVFAGVQ